MAASVTSAPPHRANEATHTGEIEERSTELAKKCWNEDETFLPLDEVAEFLGGRNELSRRTLHHYVQYHDFANMRVDEAFRRLCTKLYLKAETQQVDRILEKFSQRYFICNPTSIFGSADVVHAITYSLLLLNTDLHVADVSTRMSRVQYVRNVMNVVLSQRQQSLAKQGSGEGSEPNTTKGTLAEKGSNAVPRGWEMAVETMLKDMYDSVKYDQIQQTALNSSNSDTSTGGKTSQDPGSSSSSLHLSRIGFAFSLSRAIGSGAEEDDSESIAPTQPFPESNTHITDEELALCGAPWAKEGLLSRKLYWESADVKSTDTAWSDVFAVVSQGELKMFTFGQNSGGVESDAGAVTGDGNWLSSAASAGDVPLAQSHAEVLKQRYNRQRLHCFNLTLASGAMYFFQAGTKALVEEWVSTCNYWAARHSKEPLVGGVSNMDYGWNRAGVTGQANASSSSRSPNGAQDRDSEAGSNAANISIWTGMRAFAGHALRGLTREPVRLNDWMAPIPSTIASTCDEETQLRAMENQLHQVDEDIQQHRNLRDPMIKLHWRSPNLQKAQANWQRKADYLETERRKYTAYVDSLRSARQLREKKRQIKALGSKPARGGQSPNRAI